MPQTNSSLFFFKVFWTIPSSSCVVPHSKLRDIPVALEKWVTGRLKSMPRIVWSIGVERGLGSRQSICLPHCMWACPFPAPWLIFFICTMGMVIITNFRVSWSLNELIYVKHFQQGGFAVILATHSRFQKMIKQIQPLPFDKWGGQRFPKARGEGATKPRAQVCSQSQPGFSRHSIHAHLLPVITQYWMGYL